MRSLAPAAALAALAFAAAAPGQAQGAAERFGLTVELAGALGEAHAIRVVCNGDQDQYWRRYMQDMLDVEANSEDGRAALVQAFNRGYRSQSGRYEACTPDLPAVEAQIASRGRALAEAVAQTYLEPPAPEPDPFLPAPVPALP
jgi:uncharacterized protein (TIGR02301 family)